MIKSTLGLTVAVLTSAALTFGGGTVVYQHFAKASELKEETAKRILADNLDKLHDLSERLLEKEIIDSREVDEILGIPVAEKKPRQTASAKPMPVQTTEASKLEQEPPGSELGLQT